MTQSERLKRLRIEASARGLCYVCRCRFPRPGVKTCDDCLARIKYHSQTSGKTRDRLRRAESAARKVRERKQAGVCIRCGRRDPVVGYVSCSVCLDAVANSVRKSTAKKRGGPQIKFPFCSVCNLPGHNRQRHERPAVLP